MSEERVVMPQPDIRPFAWWEGYLYILMAPYAYEWVAEAGAGPGATVDRMRLTVPQHFETDGASVPRYLWSLTGIERDGLHRPAALLHDFLYRFAGRIPNGSQETCIDGEWIPLVGVTWKREEADALFARVLRELGVGKVKRRLMYLGVRAGGWRPWRRAMQDGRDAREKLREAQPGQRS